MPIGNVTTASMEQELRAACLELERGLRSGQECSAEQLLKLYPRLCDDPDSALELIFAEFVLRRKRGEQSPPEQWYERFPAWRERLQRLFHVYELMAEGSQATGVAGDTVRTGESNPAPPISPRPARTIGNYELLEEVARGGMGVVFKARHSSLKRIVAVKLILAGEHAGQDQRARFRQEAEAAARLQHPNIVQIFEIGQEGNLPFLAMEYVDGLRLDELLIQRRAEGSLGLPAQQSAELVACLARAIHHAHQHGVVHRDLKPANVLIVDSGLPVADSPDQSAIHIPHSVIPKITDFGLAKTLGESHLETQSGQLLGTPSYMAPEQAAGRHADIGPPTDVFALGIILYELLTGYLPFQGTSVEETLERVRTVEPIPPAQLQASIPRDLQTICLKCLQKESVKRYVSAEALAEDLGRMLRDEPIHARSIGRGERAWRWCRRNPMVASLTGLVGILLVGGFAVSTGLAAWAINEKAGADASASQAQTSAIQERAARSLAEHRFTQAEKAVDDYLLGIEDNELLQKADFYELRKQLLRSALPFYEDFVKQKPGDAALEAKRGHAFRRLAMIHQEVDEWDDALKNYRHMAEIFEKLVAQFPDNPDYVDQLAVSHSHQGNVLREIGKYADAEIELSKAIPLGQQLIERVANVADYKWTLSSCYGNLSNVHFEQGHWAESETECRRALDIQTQLTIEHPESAKYAQAQANSHSNLGLALFKQGKGQLGVDEYRKTIAIQERLMKRFPDKSNYRHDLGRSHMNLGVLLQELKLWDDAEEADKQAIAMYQALVDEFVTIPTYRSQLAGSHYNLGNLRGAQGDLARQEVEYREALKLDYQLVERYPQMAQYKSSLATTLSNLAGSLRKQGRLDESQKLYLEAVDNQLEARRLVPTNIFFAEALRHHYEGLADVSLKRKDHAVTTKAADGLGTIRPEAGEDALWAARYFGRCVVLVRQDTSLSDDARQSLAQAYADQAMVHLRESVRRGYRDIDRLKTLDALAPLRDRDDFKKMTSASVSAN